MHFSKFNHLLVAAKKALNTQFSINNFVKQLGVDREYEILAVLEFSSARKRMSVIVRDNEEDQIWLMCKGADDVILSRLSKQSKYEGLMFMNC